MTGAAKTMVVILFTSLCFQKLVAEILPVEHFARLPDLRSAQLSPDGKKVAAIVAVDGESIVVTLDEDGVTHPLIKTDNEDAMIRWIRWGNDERVLLSYRAPSVRFGTKTTETRLMSIRYDGTDKEEMFRPRSSDNWLPQLQDKVVDILPDDDKHFLVSLDVSGVGSRGVYRIDIESGSRRTVKRSQPDAKDWVTDQQGRPRIAVTFEDTDYEILVFDVDGKNPRTLWEFTSFSENVVWPLGFGLDPNTLYVRAYHEGRYAIFNVNLEDPELRLELVISDPYRDIEGELIHSPRTRDAVGVFYSGGDGIYHFWDEGYRNFATSIDAVLPDTFNRIVGFSNNERRYLIYSSNDVTPGIYYLGDRDQGLLQPLGRSYPELDSLDLSPKNRIQISARDELELEAYLTVPESPKDGPMPTIVFPHGGPISRDDSDFDYWTQFFANRGYAVLQVNFRGSSGYGYDFMKAGLQNYGLTMQDDLEDSTRWLIDAGIADPDRICIVGASYGGYAALMGVADTPELYACAVSFAGLSDLNKFMISKRNYLNYEVVKEQFGTDKGQLRETSPRRLADQITVPVLLAHGDKDRVVPVDHSRDMRKALGVADKEYEYLEFDDGDHYLSNAEHRMEFFKAMDVFLAKYLKPLHQGSTN